MTDRRKQQNFLALHHYLTEPLWETLKEGPRERAEAALWRHCWCLGLRCPSEVTYALVLEILRQSSKHPPKPLTVFERYNLNELKTSWKKLKLCKKADDFQYHDYLEQLPLEPADLPAEWSVQAFALHEAVPCRTSSLCIVDFFRLFL